jgi:hypothetical protein
LISTKPEGLTAKMAETPLTGQPHSGIGARGIADPARRKARSVHGGTHAWRGCGTADGDHSVDYVCRYLHLEHMRGWAHPAGKVASTELPWRHGATGRAEDARRCGDGVVASRPTSA